MLVKLSGFVIDLYHDPEKGKNIYVTFAGQECGQVKFVAQGYNPSDFPAMVPLTLTAVVKGQRYQNEQVLYLQPGAKIERFVAAAAPTSASK